MARVRSWCFTVNNYNDDDVDAVERLASDVDYLIFGFEKGANDTPHLQGYLFYKNKTSLRALKTLLPRAHFEVARGNHEQNIKYCSKDGDYSEFGKRPLTQVEQSLSGKEVWDEVLALAKEDRLDEIPSKIFISHYRTLKQIAFDHRVHSNLTNDEWDNGRTNLWIYGPSDTGKSRYARETFPDHYLKMCNKWWDNYQGEDTVLIEEFEKSHSVLSHHLKVWSDRYAFQVEIKCHATVIRPKRIVVTSNYSMEEIWPAEIDGVVIPLRRRFQCLHFHSLSVYHELKEINKS